jgi:peptidoglycan hydrolase-like protein with peptidoglycan-binding domain
MRGVGGLREDGLTTRRAAVVVGVTAAALVGFGAALVVPGVGGHDARGAGTPLRPPATGAASRPADAPGTDPDGAGTLREGDSGPAVSELQQRLLRIPDVYRDGATDGRYDAVLRAAVARFQLWYGIRGDESGVYGNDTRRDLESRTVL